MKVVSIKSSRARGHDNSERPVAESTAPIQGVALAAVLVRGGSRA